MKEAISMHSMQSRRSNASTSSASSSSKPPPHPSFGWTVGDEPKLGTVEEELNGATIGAHDGAIGSGPPVSPTSRSPPSAHDGANSCVSVRSTLESAHSADVHGRWTRRRRLAEP